ncbi:MAG: cell division protein FtsL [Acidobacteriota bacterium]|jgi:cell division protein FtsL|nr:cell division protein FtsL [Acidobacteriota bacterium]
MVDLAKGVAVRNYGLKNTPDSEIMRESFLMFLPLAVIASVFTFQIWVRSQTVHLGYQTQELRAQREELLRDRQHLVVEEQTLKSPKWLDEIAIKELGLVVVRPDQVLPPPVKNWDSDNSKDTLVGNLVRPNSVKRSSAF